MLRAWPPSLTRSRLRKHHDIAAVVVTQSWRAATHWAASNVRGSVITGTRLREADQYARQGQSDDRERCGGHRRYGSAERDLGLDAGEPSRWLR